MSNPSKIANYTDMFIPKWTKPVHQSKRDYGCMEEGKFALFEMNSPSYVFNSSTKAKFSRFRYEWDDSGDDESVLSHKPQSSCRKIDD
jgi:hypothetical protein